LCQKLRGHYQYYGIRGNYRRLDTLCRYAAKAWRYWLSRRSHKSAIPWEKFDRLHDRLPLPAPESSMPSEGVCRAAKFCVRVVLRLWLPRNQMPK